MDLGCGDGAVTQQIADAGSEVLGVDASAEQVARANQRGLNAEQIAAEALAFENEFDAIYSNATIHWLSDEYDWVARLYRALKPGGRLVVEGGGAGNIASILDALRTVMPDYGVDVADCMPWTFRSEAHMQSLLESAGFQVGQMRLFERPTPLSDANIRDWLELMAGDFLNGLAAKDREAALAALETQLRPALFSEVQGWVVDYVRLRFVALKGRGR